MKLKSLTYGFNSSQKVNEMEKEPAYIRRKGKTGKCGSQQSVAGFKIYAEQWRWKKAWDKAE